jgi:uncharacterized protein
MKRWGVAVAMGLLIASCQSGNSQADAVTSIGSLAIAPQLETAVAATAEVFAAVDGLCADPSLVSLAEARSAWTNARIAWEPAELATFFGPARALGTVSHVDPEPDPEDIDRLIESGTPIDTEYVADRASSTQRGLGTLEHLLFGSVELEPGSSSCDLAVAVAEVIGNETTALRDGWIVSDAGGGPYLTTFETSPGNEAVTRAVGAIVETLRRQSMAEIGAAIGMTAADPDPEAIPEGEAEAGAATYSSQMTGIRLWLEAGNDSSLLSLISARSPDLADLIEDHLDAIDSDLGVIDGPMQEIAAENPERLNPVFQKIGSLRALFEADVTSLLDLNLGFSDADGDSG